MRELAESYPVQVILPGVGSTTQHLFYRSQATDEAEMCATLQWLAGAWSDMARAA